jgi:carboxypeptidase C (cathepsin A)
MHHLNLQSSLAAALLLLAGHHAALAAPRKSSKGEFLVDKATVAKHAPAFNSFDGDIFAGHIPMRQKNGNDGELYFMMFDATEKFHDDTIIVWLNGGPGCSSFAGGLFFEMGPITVPIRPAGYMGSKKLAPLVPNEYAWTKASAVMYLEQPAGVGFSSGIEPRSEDDLSSDFYFFFQNFLDIFTDYRDKRLFIVGESYAGHYAPSMAHKLHQMNKKNKDPARHINLAGVGVGNGWVDAKVQGEAVIDYAYWHGMIDATTKAALHEQFQVCLDGGVPKAPLFHAFNVPDECGTMGAVLSAAGAGALKGPWRGGPNTYDVTTWDLYPVLLGRNGTIDNFFNNPEIRKAIHAPTNVMVWEQCIPGAGRRRLSVDGTGETTGEDVALFHHPTDRMLMLEDDRPLSVMPYISELLDDAGVDVLFYNGDRDMSCCIQGSEKLLNEMSWSGQKNWLNPYVNQRGLWVVDNEVAGYGKGYKNLQFVAVYNSGHLVPYNVPKPALNLITRFLGGDSFVDAELPIYPGVGGGPKANMAAEVSGKGEEGSNGEGGNGYNRVLVGFACFIGGITCSLILGKFIKQQKNQMHMYSEVPSIPPSPGMGWNVQIN